MTNIEKKYQTKQQVFSLKKNALNLVSKKSSNLLLEEKAFYIVIAGKLFHTQLNVKS